MHNGSVQGHHFAAQSRFGVPALRRVSQDFMDLVSKLIDFEGGQLDQEETVELFQRLIDSGIIWQLQGSYQRTALDLIGVGLCVLPPNVVQVRT